MYMILSLDEVINLKNRYPEENLFIENAEDVVAMGDFVGSTSGINASGSSKKDFIV